MDSKAKRRIVVLVGLGGAMLTFITRPSVVLLWLLLFYFFGSDYLGVAPLKPYELIEVLGDAKEATIAAAGLVVAVASVAAFKRAKRLDLELAAAADIKVLIRDLSEVLSRHAVYCEGLLEAKDQFVAGMDGSRLTADQRQRSRSDMAANWSVLTATSDQARNDQRSMWPFVSRLLALKEQHSAVLRSRIIFPILLDNSQRKLEKIASAPHFPIPASDSLLRDYMPAFMIFDAAVVKNYLDVNARNYMALMGNLGGASAIGSLSVAPVSLITAVRMGWQVWKI